MADISNEWFVWENADILWIMIPWYTCCIVEDIYVHKIESKLKKLIFI